MGVRIVTGNLLYASENVIGHQVNCKGVGRSGVAAQINSAFPEAYESYSKKCKEHLSKDLLGTVDVVSVGKDKWIANIFGQDDFGRKGQYTDYAALRRACEVLNIFLMENKLTLALPYKIGCDRGGGDWLEVYDILLKSFDGCEVTLYKLG